MTEYKQGYIISIVKKLNSPVIKEVLILELILENKQEAYRLYDLLANCYVHVGYAVNVNEIQHEND